MLFKPAGAHTPARNGEICAMSALVAKLILCGLTYADEEARF